MRARIRREDSGEVGSVAQVETRADHARCRDGRTAVAKVPAACRLAVHAAPRRIVLRETLRDRAPWVADARPCRHSLPGWRWLEMTAPLPDFMGLLPTRGSSRGGAVPSWSPPIPREPSCQRIND